MEQQELQQLFERMTMKEKIGQLMQFAGYFHINNNNKDPVTGPDNLIIDSEDISISGSVLGSAGAKKNKEIQDKYLKESRLKIPLLFMADVINGFRTIFPIPIALGATWDPELVEKLQSISAKEAASAGVHVTFAPMVDLVRDPRWGRVMESTGEDPYLNELFSKASVKGIQGNNLQNDFEKIAACVKHFVGYGLSEGGRDYNTVDLSERALREFHLPAFKAAIDEGVELVMTSFNTINSIPATGNRWLMRDILRDDLQFDGVLISDFGAVKELIPHGVAEDESEAAEKAIHAGVDIEMMSTCYDHLESLSDTGKVDSSLIDEAVMRILTLKNKLGLFESPYRGSSEEKESEVINHPDHRELARITAEKSSVLLKNNGVLPIHQEKIGLIGPYANNKDILGEWSIFGKQEEAVTLKDGFDTANISYEYAKGTEMYERSESLLQEAVRVGENVDHIVLAIGEGKDRSGEGRSRSSITLSDNQLELLFALEEIGKPISVVLFNARPLELSAIEGVVDSILEVWHPGSEGGNAITNLLLGKVNPQGKLTMSFPVNTGQIPVYYNAYSTGRPLPAGSEGRFFSRYIDIPNEPLYPFGYGLSYTNFTYDSLRLTSDTLGEGQSLTVSVEVQNTGSVSGIETVQLYIQDKVGEVVRPVKELKGFKKVTLEPNEVVTVDFEITVDMLKYYHSDSSYTNDSGTFNVYVGTNSTDVLSDTFHFNK